MKNDITQVSGRRGPKQGPPIRKITIGFRIYELAAIQRFKLSKKKPYPTVLIDGLQLAPGFSGILKQEKQKYDRKQEREAAHASQGSTEAVADEYN